MTSKEKYLDETGEAAIREAAALGMNAEQAEAYAAAQRYWSLKIRALQARFKIVRDQRIELDAGIRERAVAAEALVSRLSGHVAEWRERARSAEARLETLRGQRVELEQKVLDLLDSEQRARTDAETFERLWRSRRAEAADSTSSAAYMVTAGSYEDVSTIAVFAVEEEAQAFADRWNLDNLERIEHADDRACVEEVDFYGSGAWRPVGPVIDGEIANHIHGIGQ